ncbi:MAG: segregation/condensation protein A [bacterium]|nr:segregation/condensation protein A [bacterium]
MEYEINIQEFQGPLDLLLHLIKKENININDISIDEITKQYLNYIETLEKLNLDIASEYLVMASELISIKSYSLLPQKEKDEDLEEDPKEQLIKKLLEYEQYKNITNELKKLEDYRKGVFTKQVDSLNDFKSENDNIDYGISLDDLKQAFFNILNQKEINKPLNTKIENKEYSIEKRCFEIKNILKKKKKIIFNELFDRLEKNYVVITFLSILSMSKNQELIIEQDENFKNIIIKEKSVKV